MGNKATPHLVPQLETPRLVLRTRVPGDADDIFAYAADPDMAQYTLWSAHTTLKDSQQFIAWILGGSLGARGTPILSARTGSNKALGLTAKTLAFGKHDRSTE